MARKKALIADKRISEVDISGRIKEEKNRDRFIPRLIFTRLLYGGMSVIEASDNVGISKRVGYQWIKRCNESVSMA